MDFLDIAKRRYSTKRYNPHKKLPAEAVARLKEILRFAPSSINSQPWRFTFVQDPGLKDQLARVSYHNEHKIQQCGLLIVFEVIDDLGVFERYVDTRMEKAHAEAYYNARQTMGDEQVKIWLTHQVYISLGFCLSACAVMGLDSTPMEGIDRAAYRRLLRCDPYQPIFAASVGYRADDDANAPQNTPKRRRALEDVIRSFDSATP